MPSRRSRRGLSDAGDGWIGSDAEDESSTTLSSVLIFALDNSPQLEWESKQAGADAILAKAEGSTRLAGVIQSLAQRH